MADIFEEVEEGLRQDRMSVLWKKYGLFAYLIAALLIGGVAANEYFQSEATKSIEENSARLEAALQEVEARNYQQAADQLSSIIADDIAPANIAAHYLAGVRIEGNGDIATAADVLSQSVGTAEDPTQQLALIKSAYLQAESLTREELSQLLAPLAEDDGPFGALSKELIAAKALQEGDVEFARREFSFLRLAPNVPPGVATRARQALAALPPVQEVATDPEQVVPEPVETGPDDALPDPADPAIGENTEETPE